MGLSQKGRVIKFSIAAVAASLILLSFASLIVCLNFAGCTVAHYPHVAKVRGPEIALSNTGRSLHLWREIFYETSDPTSSVRQWYQQQGWESANSGASWVKKSELFRVISVSRQTAVLLKENGSTMVAVKTTVVINYG